MLRCKQTGFLAVGLRRHFVVSYLHQIGPRENARIFTGRERLAARTLAFKGISKQVVL